MAGSKQIVNGATKLQAQATPRMDNVKITGKLIRATANLVTKNRTVSHTDVCVCVFVCVWQACLEVSQNVTLVDLLSAFNWF